MQCQRSLILLHKMAFQPFWLLLTVYCMYITISCLHKFERVIQTGQFLKSLPTQHGLPWITFVISFIVSHNLSALRLKRKNSIVIPSIFYSHDVMHSSGNCNNFSEKSISKLSNYSEFGLTGVLMTFTLPPGVPIPRGFGINAGLGAVTTRVPAASWED